MFQQWPTGKIFHQSIQLVWSSGPKEEHRTIPREVPTSSNNPASRQRRKSSPRNIEYFQEHITDTGSKSGKKSLPFVNQGRQILARGQTEVDICIGLHSRGKCFTGVQHWAGTKKKLLSPPLPLSLSLSLSSTGGFKFVSWRPKFQLRNFYQS